MREQLLRDIGVSLNKKTIFDVRQIARALNVHSEFPQKPKIIEAILQYAEGLTEPQPPSVRGAPPKSDVYDERLVLQIERCRQIFKSGDEKGENTLKVSDSSFVEGESDEVSGILERAGSNWFLFTASGEVFVADSFLSRYPLKCGDKITGSSIIKNGAPALLLINGINGYAPENAEKGRNLSTLTRVYPEKRILLSDGGDDAACRLIDMFAPLAFGQRAFISSAQGCGKTTIIKTVANAICENYPEITVIVLLLNARPEEVTDFKRGLKGGELYAATFEAPKSYTERACEAVFSYAKRLVELGRDAVVLVDGLFDGDIDGETGKKYTYSALNADEGGSLTVIAALSENAAEYDGCISTANNVIKLSKELAIRRVYPAIDAVQSFAGREETLLSPDELNAANNLRRNYGAEEIISLFKCNQKYTEITEKYKNG